MKYFISVMIMLFALVTQAQTYSTNASVCAAVRTSAYDVAETVYKSTGGSNIALEPILRLNYKQQMAGIKSPGTQEERKYWNDMAVGTLFLHNRIEEFKNILGNIEGTKGRSYSDNPTLVSLKMAAICGTFKTFDRSLTAPTYPTQP